MKLSVCTSLLGLVCTVSAHGGVLSYSMPSGNYPGFVPYNSPDGQSTIQREWDTYNPLMDPSAQVLQCNDPGAAAQESAEIAAGDDITAYWNEWPHTIGPLVVWMVACSGDCSSIPSDGWFKIGQAGLMSGTIPDGVWGQAQMINNNNSWTSTIPSALAAGNYLIRHELISIHTSNQPQFYPECATLKVTGGGSSTPSGDQTASIPGVYSMDDPAINIDIYSSENQDVTTYTVPGPDVWTG